MPLRWHTPEDHNLGDCIRHNNPRAHKRIHSTLSRPGAPGNNCVHIGLGVVFHDVLNVGLVNMSRGVLIYMVPGDNPGCTEFRIRVIIHGTQVCKYYKKICLKGFHHGTDLFLSSVDILFNLVRILVKKKASAGTEAF